MFLGEFFKAVKSAKDSPSTITTYTGFNANRLLRIPDITFLGKFFKAVISAKESSSTITQPIQDLTQTGYNEFWICVHRI